MAIAISAPARSIEATATSTSQRRMTARIGRSCTSTSNIDSSSVSGSMPWDIVRLPWGSMSTHRTRWPSSAKAAARFSVVVVLATPPFWLAKAITLAWPVTSRSDRCRLNPHGPTTFAAGPGIPPSAPVRGHDDDRHGGAAGDLALAPHDHELGVERALEHGAHDVLVRADGVDDLAARGDAALAQLGEA